MQTKIQGWQSWTPCNQYPNFIDLFSRHFYSPFNQTGWNILTKERAQQKPVAGWCSFYAYGKNISKEKILSNARILSENIKPNMDTYVIIDDGWEIWHKTDLINTAQQIKKLSLKPGIWCAPLLTNIPNSNQLPVFPFNYIQDIENPKIFNKQINLIEILVEKYGFEFLKLDFLYALHHLKKYKDSATPDQILKYFLVTIRKKYPNIHINLCGCPLGLGIEVCNSMRISADNVSPYFDNLWPINQIFHTHRLKQLENNLQSRLHTNKYWLLDPDVFSCRKSVGLTESQILKLQYLFKKANGLYFLGDDLTKLSNQEIDKYIKPLFSSGRWGKNKSLS